MEHHRIVVIGGGITGQLFQHCVPEAVIYDWQKSRAVRPLTRNFGGNYLWKPIPGLACRSFSVITHIDGQPATPDSIMAYKKKIGKVYEAETANNWADQFQPSMTGWDFLELPEARIHYGHRIIGINDVSRTIRFDSVDQKTISYTYLISTIPLYALLNQIRWPALPIEFRPIYIRVIDRPPDRRFDPDVFYVNYLSDPDVQAYRFSDRNDERHYESLSPLTGHRSSKFTPGKIYHHPSVTTVLTLLEKQNIFTFGRYGSWNPDELVHETWERIVAWKEQHA